LSELALGSAIVGRTFSVQVAKWAIMEGCVVKRKNSRILNDRTVWFGKNWFADGCVWHQSRLEGTTTVKNSQASQTRLFGD